MMMTQRLEEAGKRLRKKIGVRGLNTLTAITRHMQQIYCEARNGELDVQKAGTLVRILERIRLAMAASLYDKRLERLEQIIGTRDGRRLVARSDSHYSHDELDEEGAQLQ
jgi:hypothetical protein